MARHLDHWLKLRQLRIVSAVDSQGSITGASRLVGLSQPAVTKALHELEKTVGLQLYARNSRGVEPTAAGLAVIRSARRILAELSRLDDELDIVCNRDARHVAIGVTPAPAASLLPYVLADLRATRPELRVEVTEGEVEALKSALIGGGIDMIIGDLQLGGGHDGLLRNVICYDQVVMIARAGHPLAGTMPTLDEVARYDLIVPPINRRLGNEVQLALAALPDFRPTLVHSTSIGFAREMVRATDTIALASQLMMSADILRGASRVLSLELGVAPVPFGVICRDDADRSLVLEQVVAGLRKTVRALTENETPLTSS